MTKIKASSSLLKSNTMKAQVALLILGIVKTFSAPTEILVPHVATQYHAQDELGQYTYGYSGGPSAKHEEKTADGTTRGGYSYVDSNGLVQSAIYVSDPVNGFRVAATNLPVGPVPAKTEDSVAVVPEVSVITPVATAVPEAPVSVVSETVVPESSVVLPESSIHEEKPEVSEEVEEKSEEPVENDSEAVEVQSIDVKEEPQNVQTDIVQSVVQAPVPVLAPAPVSVVTSVLEPSQAAPIAPLAPAQVEPIAPLAPAQVAPIAPLIPAQVAPSAPQVTPVISKTQAISPVVVKSSVPIHIASQYHAQNELGEYIYGYAGGPSAKHEEKSADGITKGGYSYIDAHGVVQNAVYVSDPVGGFRVSATNIPQQPAPAYIPDSPEVEEAKQKLFQAQAEHIAKLAQS